MNKKRVIAVFLIFLIVGIVFLVIDRIKENYLSSREVLYLSSYVNCAWGYQEHGYIIYYNGDIESYKYEEKYEDHFKRKRLKKDKISEYELKRLIELSNLIEDKVESSQSLGADIGTWTKKIYSKRMEKLILLSKSGDYVAKNSTKECEEILGLTQNLYDKYLAN